MQLARICCLFAAALLSIHSAGLAQETAEGDDLASEFKGMKLIKLSNRSDSDFGYRCTLYTDEEHKKILEQFRTGSDAGKREFYGTYLILEIKKDRLILVPEAWSERRKVRVIALRYISDVYRAGVYEDVEK